MKPMTHNTARRTGYTSLGRVKSIGGHQRQRGSLLILCVTVLVIIALIGIAFLQRVRLDQAATARHERNYMDLVINGILAEVGTQLTDDIFDNSLTGKELYDYPWTKDGTQINAERIDGTPVSVNGSGTAGKMNHEDDRWLASSAPVYNRNTNTYNWLHLTNLTGIWLDLENPNPNLVEEPINVASTVSQPQLLKRNSDTDISIANLERIPGPTRTIPLGVDADLDGIMDSRWQWVPVSVRDFAGRKYVMAIRIVDLGSMLNVNTATLATLDGDTPFNSTMRGYTPAGADLSRFFKRVNYNDNRLMNNSGFPGDWAREIRAVLDTRSLQGTSAPLLPSNYGFPLSARENTRLWENQSAIYGNLDRNYLADSEMELRRFGGINSASIVSPLEDDLPKLLRQDPEFERLRGAEASYLDVVREPTRSNRALSKWFYGVNPSDNTDPDTNSVAVRNREFPAIRHMLTTASGVGAYVTKYGGSASPGGRLKFDVKQQFTNTGELRERIQQAFRLPNPTAPNSNWYLGIADPRAQADMVDEYVVAIQDYSDADNIPTALNGFYGMERLPFLREVYVQALYADVLGDTSDKAPWEAGYDSSMPGTNYVGLQYDPVAVGGDTRAMVIELGNPFAHRINGIDSLDPVSNQVEPNGLNGRVRVVVRQGGNTTTWMFGDPAVTPTPDIDARDSASAGDTLLIFSPPVDKIAETGGAHDGSNLLADVGVVNGAQTLELLPGTLTANFTPNGGTITVELDVLTSDGITWVTYDRLETDPDTDLPAPATHPSTPAPANNQFAQASFARDSQNINFVVDDGVAAGDLQTNLPNSGSYSTGTDRLGNDNKGSASISQYGGIYSNFFNRLQLPIADQPMRSTAELAWVHMFGFTSSQTFSERMSASGPVGLPANEHFLLIDPTDPDFKVLPSPPIGAGVSHAAVLMDVFTTVSPSDDGRDNDNDDGDDDPTTSNTATLPDLPSIDNLTEQFIPGTINVNTAPLHILTLGSPLAESIDNIEKLMRMIVAYRDQPILAAANYPNDTTVPFNDVSGTPNIRETINTGPIAAVDRQSGTGFKPGIGSIGELMFLNPYGPGAASQFNVYNMYRYGRDNTASLPNKVDLYPDPDENGSVAVPLGDDNEQKLARFQMLGQTFTVRSDRFVVYAVVRGYDWDPNKPGPGPNPMHGAPAETAQFIAIFDRGSMEKKTDTPRVIGYVRLQ